MLQFLISIVIAIAMPLALRFYSSKGNLFESHYNVDSNGYFSTDYSSAREVLYSIYAKHQTSNKYFIFYIKISQLFEGKAKAAGFDLSLSSLMHPVDSSKLKSTLLSTKINLTTTVAVYKGLPNKFLIHISGKAASFEFQK